MHPDSEKTDAPSNELIGAAIEVHREKGPGLIGSICERCLHRELELRRVPAVSQRIVRTDHKGLTFDEPLRPDVRAGDCPPVEVKAVERVLPIHKGRPLSCMKPLRALVGLPINLHEPVLKNALTRLLLPDAILA